MGSGGRAGAVSRHGDAGAHAGLPGQGRRVVGCAQGPALCAGVVHALHTCCGVAVGVQGGLATLRGGRCPGRTIGGTCGHSRVARSSRNVHPFATASLKLEKTPTKPRSPNSPVTGTSSGAVRASSRFSLRAHSRHVHAHLLARQHAASRAAALLTTSDRTPRPLRGSAAPPPTRSTG